MAYLALVRHGVTDWNAAGRWHGWADIPLNGEGRKEARESAKALEGLKIDAVYTSTLKRNVQTFEEIRNVLNLKCPVVSTPVINERNYGIYTGKNKWEVEKELGHEEFIKLRRGWNYPIPEGESLQDVYNRIIPFYKTKILEDLKNGKNVLVVSSGNALRSLMKYLKNISDEDIANMNLNFGEIHIFEIDNDGKALNEEVKNADLFQGKN